MRMLREFLPLVAGLILGMLGSNLLQLGQQNTYFEANDLENFFLKNQIASGEVELAQIVGSNWISVCLFGPGSDVSLHLDSKIGVGRWSLKNGRIVGEGILEYLNKIVLINQEGGVYVMNFDERRFEFTGPSECQNVLKIRISRSEKEINRDPDGYGDHFTTYKMLVKD